MRRTDAITTHIEAQRRGEVLFVADHHVDQRSEAAVHRRGLLLSTDLPPRARRDSGEVQAIAKRPSNTVVTHHRTSD
jgi:hypothetical protein